MLQRQVRGLILLISSGGVSWLRSGMARPRVTLPPRRVHRQLAMCVPDDPEVLQRQVRPSTS